MKLNQKYRYSILTLTTIAPMPLKADVVGLKADWPRVPWDKVGLTTNAMAKLATEIAGVAQTAYVIEPFENICDDSVEFGYEIVLESTQAIDPERINRIAAACKMFTESILNNDDWHTPQFHLGPKLNNADLITIDSARTDYLEKYGNCKIPVPFLCKIDDNHITCAGQYAKKPPRPARKANTISISAKIEGTERKEGEEDDSLLKFKNASCVVVDLTTNKRHKLAINSQDILLEAHRCTYQRIFYTLIVREEYGADDQVTYVLVKIGDPSEINQPRLISDS